MDEEIIDPFDNTELVARQTRVALKMRREGHGFFDIAQELTKFSERHVSMKLVRLRIRDHWKQVEREACEEHLQWELDRLDDLLRRAYAILKDEDDPDVRLKAMDRMLKIGERRSKLLGLDAPQRVDATVTETTQADLELDEMVREAKARNALKEQELRERRAR